MDEKLLLKQFNTDAGTAFLEVIRCSPVPLDARAIKEKIKAAGGKRPDVDVKWKTLQKHLNLHPHIRKPTKTKYEWSIEPITSAEALQRLAASVLKSVPSWLTTAYISIVADTLAAAETSGMRAQSTWSEQRDLEKAQILATIAVEVERLVIEKKSPSEVLVWIHDEAGAKRLELVAKQGQRIPFDPETHDVQAGVLPRRGAEVLVVRSGFRWLGGETPTMVVRPLVRAL